MGQAACKVDDDCRGLAYVDAVSCVSELCEVKTCSQVHHHAVASPASLELVQGYSVYGKSFCMLPCNGNSTCVAPAMPRVKDAYCADADTDFCVATVCDDVRLPIQSL
jgi:hypothetical protein